MRRDFLGFWIAIGILLWACVVFTPEPARCYNCGGSCATRLSCASGCDCLFAEDDDNEHNGRCG